MLLGLGIDTGGTFTDGVIYDFDEGKVLQRAKRQTTPFRLSDGIEALMDALDAEKLKQLRLVALSTTLATNACVENRGSRVALFLLGYDPGLVERLKGEYGLDAAQHIIVAPGAHTQRGDLAQQPDYEALMERARAVAGTVDAFGISEYWGVRNPEFEKELKKRLRAEFDLPVAAAHELTVEINSMRRAATTLLNARLTPLIDELMRAVRAAMRQKGISAPLMIVRGDGSLMTDAFAAEYPVETLLSGPASSVTGAMRLSGCSDMIAVDIGGTTTDLAMVRGGLTQMSSDGVDVGAWRTGTRAIQIKTIGLGGDSAVDRDERGNLTLGPERALPLCALAKEYPRVAEVLEAVEQDGSYQSYYRGTFYKILRRPDENMELNDHERRLLAALKDGPLSVDELARAVGSRPYFIYSDRLEKLGILIQSKITPTDVMTLRGDFDQFDLRAARLGLSILAFQMDMEVEALMDKIMDMASERLYRVIAGFVLERRLKKPLNEPVSMGLGYFGAGDEVEVSFKVRLPLVGIGAPTGVMLPYAAKKLGAECVLPRDFDVANAVGAITGSVVVEEMVVVKPRYDVSGITGYTAHSSEERMECEDEEQAMDWARRQARQIVAQKAQAMGAESFEVTVEEDAQSGWAAGLAQQSMLLEKTVLARAVGRIQVLEK
jgi:N-methylhydantoinase A/oxoprolinase/acetone carboxylase beta subunit